MKKIKHKTNMDMTPEDIEWIRCYYSKDREWPISTCSDPHFSDISDGKKTMECRLARGKWNLILPGHTFQLKLPNEKIVCFVDVVNVERGKLLDLWHKYGEAMLPRVKTEEEVIKVYQDIYKNILIDGNTYLVCMHLKSQGTLAY